MLTVLRLGLRGVAALRIKIENLSRLLVDPFELSLLIRQNLFFLEPKINLLLRILDGVGTVADIATDILEANQHGILKWESGRAYDCVVTTNGTGSR